MVLLTIILSVEAAQRASWWTCPSSVRANSLTGGREN
jgi:hypothetical protein